jgi:A/G-specific adenine glycosylase
MRTVRAYYKKHGRHSLPWRKTHDPYHILVSEVMLQQTQVDRVIPKYNAFIKRFPDMTTLAHASLGDVLRLWQGLGYNRRAKFLHTCARAVLKEHAGILPNTYDALCALPGIGPYTAGAVLAFAHNKPVVMIETNIRTVYIHHFFADKGGVTDAELRPLIEQTLDTKHAGMWYAALMDYGTHLKSSIGNLSRKSAHYTKQSKFKGSDREVRGAILRALVSKKLTLVQLIRETKLEKSRTKAQLAALTAEGMLQKKKGAYMLP